MDISRVVNIGKERDDNYKQEDYQKRNRKDNKSEVKEVTTSDINDIRKQTAELNRNSGSFQEILLMEARKELHNVIDNLESNKKKPSEIVTDFPSEEIIKLSKMIKFK